MIKLLIADDSALMRKLLEGIFRDEGDFDIRVARNGDEALALVRSFQPQVVTLDVQMPGMDGLTCLGQIMLEAPRPVVMISSLTEEGAEATLEAIALGAVDFLAKPTGTVSLEIDRLRPIVVAKVRGAATARIRPTLRLRERIRHQFRGAGVPGRMARPKGSSTKAGNAPAQGLVLIGISTGGPPALDVVLAQLPGALTWPVLIAQHMPASFTGPFANRLDRECELKVVEVARPMLLHPGTVYIARGDADVVVASRAKGLVAMPVPGSREHPWHPSVDRMVMSALEHYDPKQLVGVLMTGMGNDGAEAMTRLREAGGRTIAEAKTTAVVWGMPGELVRRGGAEVVLPLEDIASTVVEWIGANAAR